MTKELALKTLADIYEAFGVEEEAKADSALMPLLESDSLDFDNGSGFISYNLKAPLDLKNDGTVNVVKFREATAGELEYIRKGMNVNRSLETICTGDMVTMTLRVLVKTGGLATGLADRLKRRDITVLTPILTELGFFYI